MQFFPRTWNAAGQSQPNLKWDLCRKNTLFFNSGCLVILLRQVALYLHSRSQNLSIPSDFRSKVLLQADWTGNQLQLLCAAFVQCLSFPWVYYHCHSYQNWVSICHDQVHLADRSQWSSTRSSLTFICSVQRPSMWSNKQSRRACRQGYIVPNTTTLNLLH